MKTIAVGKIMKFPARHAAFQTADDALSYENPRSRRPHAVWSLGKLFGINVLDVDTLPVKVSAIYASKHSFVARIVSIKDPFIYAYVIIGPRDTRCKIQSIVFA